MTIHNTTRLGIINDYRRDDRTLATLNMLYYAAKKQRHNIECFYGTVSNNVLNNFSFRWDNQVYKLGRKCKDEISTWSRNFDTCFWYIQDEKLMSYIQESNPSCKHIYFDDYFSFSEKQKKFNKHIDAVVCPSTKVMDRHKGFFSDYELIALEPDLLFMPLLDPIRNRLTKSLSDKIVVTTLTDNVRITSTEVAVLLALLDHIKDLRIIFLVETLSLKEQALVNKLNKKYKGRISFRIDYSDFSVIQLSEKRIMFYIDFDKTASYATTAAVFRNAGIPVICYPTAVTSDVHVDGVTGYSIPCESVRKGLVEYSVGNSDSLLEFLYEKLSTLQYSNNILTALSKKDSRAIIKQVNSQALTKLLPSVGELTLQLRQKKKEEQILDDCFKVVDVTSTF